MPPRNTSYPLIAPCNSATAPHRCERFLYELFPGTIAFIVLTWRPANVWWHSFLSVT